MFSFILFITCGIFLLYAAVSFILFRYGKQYYVQHTITYDPHTRQVRLNGSIILLCFRKGSLNQLLFEYLSQHPQCYIDYQQLDHAIFKGRNVNLNKVVDAMGFKGDMKRLLFSFDSQKICYHPDKIKNISTIKIQ